MNLSSLKTLLLLAATSLAATACARGTVRPPRTAGVPRVANLHAFARLYGAVRWFHPSDAAAAIDWDRFAIEGARGVVDAPDHRALRERLVELFTPLAPTVRIVDAGETVADDPALHPASAAGLEVVAWQHKGYGDSTIATGYVSKRLRRPRTIAVPGALFAALSQSIDAAPYRGRTVRLRGKLRTAGRAQGQLWLRVDLPDGRDFFNNMARSPIISAEWAPGEIVGTVAKDATRVVFGTLNSHGGTVWYDDLELSVAADDGAWQPIEIQDGDFEQPDPLDTNELFDKLPPPGETVDLDLGSGLRARVPIALYSKDGQTLGDDPAYALQAQAARAVPPTGFDPMAGVADVIVFWNVFEHFWPYWDAVATSWSASLDATLAAALDERSTDDHLATMERLSTGAPDGHVELVCPGESQHAKLPLALDLVEGQVVVTTSIDPAVERRRVTNPDGSRHFLVGVQPTLPASRTVAGVRAGRDELLEAALAFVRTGRK